MKEMHYKIAQNVYQKIMHDELLCKERESSLKKLQKIFKDEKISCWVAFIIFYGRKELHFSWSLSSIGQ